ncbi:MAG: hypothetical protein EXR20_02385 [Bacteroidetes bacterium]|jgi:hypothetical protein|nr:hypothetical protein [Bacteroidota bacterium]
MCLNLKNQELSIEEAMMKALQIISKKEKEKNKVYVWRQRLREGKLSHSLMYEILANAGFEKVVEEKWSEKQM